jgi:hypothetical protein
MLAGLCLSLKSVTTGCDHNLQARGEVTINRGGAALPIRCWNLKHTAIQLPI